MTDTEPTFPETKLPADPEPERGAAEMRVFYQLLGNTLISGVTSSFLWFALTFWVYLETKSVVATGVIGGAFSLSTAILGPVMGTFVDRHRKHTVMMLATLVTTICFATATALYVGADHDELLDMRAPWFWMLIFFTLFGSVASMMRSIALSTTVTLLVPEDRRDRANGMVGTVTGVSFAITSVFSGLIVGFAGMGWAYVVALGLTVAALAHLATITIREARPERAVDDDEPKYIDIRGAVTAIRAVPGLFLIIGLAAFNNLLGGVFMALMDAYGLSIVSVQVWGLLFGFISLAFIAGGLAVAKFGLGPNPLRVIILGNLVNWIVCSVFTFRSSIVLLTIGMTIWLALIPVIEAAEQTVLQRSIPFERQGRVFGFAQMVENAAAPLTAFLMAPLAESVFMPFMTDGKGAEWFGSWFDTGPERGLALMFTLAGLIGIVVTLCVRASRSYRRLNAAFERPA
jgi:MFS transporter, DHA3 family, multidrug efflux protein